MKVEHEVQLGILKQLLFKPVARFSQLNQFHLDNNHFNFHLKSLLEKGIVLKDEDNYYLSDTGLELAGRMDIKSLEIVRQPKIGVSICVIDKQKRILLGTRLRDPGMTMIHFYTRKVPYDESLFETAQKCLKEETGLEAVFTLIGTVRLLEHEMDRVMFCLTASPSGGYLEITTVESENKWYSYDEALELRDVFPEFKDILKKHISGKPFCEERPLS